MTKTILVWLISGWWIYQLDKLNRRILQLPERQTASKEIKKQQFLIPAAQTGHPAHRKLFLAIRETPTSCHVCFLSPSDLNQYVKGHTRCDEPKHRRCQNSTASGSGSAERLLWCPGSEEFLWALAEHGMLGMLRRSAGFWRFDEGRRPEGKKKFEGFFFFVILPQMAFYKNLMCAVSLINTPEIWKLPQFRAWIFNISFDLFLNLFMEMCSQMSDQL